MRNFEQQVNLFHGIFIYCGIAALLLLLVAVSLFFLLKIPQVFSEITGRGAKKAIEEMEGAGVVSMRIGEDGRKRRKGFTGALGTGKLRKNTANLRRPVSSPTELMTGQETENMAQGTEQTMTESMMTEKMSPEMTASGEQGVVTETFDMGEEPTDVLNHKSWSEEEGSSSTTILNHQEPSAVYQPPQQDTMVLNVGMKTPVTEFHVLRTILEIHTDEVIE